eukprot:Skav203770  [mRNA]  locus=scaffold206:174715:175998:+ [translate_table: standard]
MVWLWSELGRPTPFGQQNFFAQGPDIRLTVPSPQKITITYTDQKPKHLDLDIVGAVPVLDKDEFYIALIVEIPYDKLWDHYYGRPKRTWSHVSRTTSLLCSGPNRAHLSPIRFQGTVLICPWPLEEKDNLLFEVLVEDAEEQVLGSFMASHDPTWGQYQVVACVRDLYEPLNWDNRPRNGVFRELVQWIEWSLMNGVDHFLVYKFNGTDSVEEDILKPYFDAGVITMVYFDSCPDHFDVRHGRTMNDCLFRAKGHAQWLMTAIDTDEYLYIPGGLVPALKSEVFGNLDRVRSLEFKRSRFTKPDKKVLDISSTRYEPLNTSQRGWMNPKFLIHVDFVHRVATHHAEMWEEDTNRIIVDPEIAKVHHYRFDYRATEGGDPAANETDESLLADVAPLTDAIRKRFGLQTSQEVEKLFVDLFETRAPNCR